MNAPKRYRIAPVEVEAMEWDGTAAGAGPIIDWVLANGPRSARYHDAEPPYFRPHIVLDQYKGGPEHVWPGDWVVAEPGDFRRYAAADFFTTYEPVS